MNTNSLPSSKTQEALESFWLKHIHQRNQSSLSKAAYCKEHELTYHQYLYWAQKLSSRPNTPTKLVSVHVAPPVHFELSSLSSQLNAPVKPSILCSLTLKTGAVLQIYDQSALNTLLAILK